MNDGGDAPRLNKHQLLTIEKSLFELARKQKSQAIPVDPPVPAFWDSVGQPLHHLQADLAETIRDLSLLSLDTCRREDEETETSTERQTRQMAEAYIDRDRH